MRKLLSAILSATLLASMFAVLGSGKADALVAGYDSLYGGESAFLALTPGATGTFTVFFQNTGSTTWVRGTSTQVDLFACLDDKVTCDVVPEEAAFNPGTWVSATRYATQTQASVATGALGTFTYSVLVPTTATTAIYRINGDLGVSSLSGSAARIHPEGYYQEANVTGTPPLTGPVTISPPSATNPTSSAGDTADNGSAGEETFTYTLRDASGNPSSPAANTTVQFSVQNTGTNTIYITNCDGASRSTAVAPGATNTSCSAIITPGGDEAASIEVDAPAASSATITATSSVGSASGTKVWQ